MTNTYKHAKQEFDILAKTTPDSVIKEFTPELLALAEKFGKSGQSGGSAPYVATSLSQVVKLILLQQNISPLTGHDSEWVEVNTNEFGDITFQNVRLSSVFKTNTSGQPYYLDAIVFKRSDGSGYIGSAFLKNGLEIFSRQFCKLPFTPKTFYIDVIDKEIKKGNFQSFIKDEKQLDKVYRYFLKK